MEQKRKRKKENSANRRREQQERDETFGEIQKKMEEREEREKWAAWLRERRGLSRMDLEKEFRSPEMKDRDIREYEKFVSEQKGGDGRELTTRREYEARMHAREKRRAEANPPVKKRIRTVDELIRDQNQLMTSDEYQRHILERKERRDDRKARWEAAKEEQTREEAKKNEEARREAAREREDAT